MPASRIGAGRTAVKTETELIDAIATDVAEGARFVPLLGAGFSAEAGIPTATELKTFLRYCVVRVLAGWCPRTGTWPDLGTAYQAAYDDARLAAPGDDALPAAVAASGTRNDWREMLRFLAHYYRKPGAPEAPESIVRGTHSEAVIDRAFAHVTSGRSPALSHTMLAHLADSLRIHTILTTNFDSLVERAFEQLAMPLQVFDVHVRAGLPSSLLVLAERSIVKLHGSRFGLRADESLDGPPPRADEEQFVGYLQGRGRAGSDPSA